MTEASDQHDPGKKAGNEGSAEKDQLSELRDLLLGPERARLDSLKKKLEGLDLDAENVGRILPAAIRHRSEKDRTLTRALVPTVEEILTLSVKRDPRTLVNALFPVMGPAIRKTIAETFRKMIQSFNQALEQSFSIQGLKWRLEAFRTGKSFGEVVLLHSLIYRVEQVFLIHKETGLLLQHVVAEAIPFQDGDMVSGMLTAIQDFVRDSFRAEEGDVLETMQVGDLTVWVEQGPHAVLAGVIRGNTPEELRSVFQEAIEAIHLERGEALEAFDGDASPFASIRHHLEACLQDKFHSRPRKISPLFWILLGAVLIGLGLWAFLSVRDHLRWVNYRESLDATPGIVITSCDKHQGKLVLSGLRDPLAPDPSEMLSDTKINPEKVVSRWEPYHALHPDYILVRAKGVLAPPDTVTLRVEGGLLEAVGSAPGEWISEARKLARMIPGVSEYRDEDLADLTAVEFDELKEKIEAQVLLFEVGTARFLPGGDVALASLADEIVRLIDLGNARGRVAHIEVIGHNDKSGMENVNRQLRKKRAEKVRAYLGAEGIEASRLLTSDPGRGGLLREELTDEDRRFNRAASFRVLVDGEGRKE